MKVCIMVYASQKGLLASLGKELQARGHELVFVARDANVAAVIRRHFPELPSAGLVVLSECAEPVAGNLVAECLRREEEYGETFAMMTAHDRGLGKGYLFNVQNHPGVRKAWWTKERKYKETLRDFVKYEGALDRLCPDLVMSVGIPKAAYLICRARGIPVRILTPPRFGALYRWTENETEGSLILDKALEARVREFLETGEAPCTRLEQTTFAQHFFAKYRYDYLSAFKMVIGRVLVESCQMLKGNHKRFRDGYEYLGWCRPLLSKPFIYKYFERHGVRPDELKESRVVLFPLHLEPEASLLNISPELNNSMELITWVSKSLPADTALVVKEHPDSFGLRPRAFYDNLRRMANVFLAHPEVHGRQWLARCDMLANITSTMAFEAVAMEKCVLSFGAHQVINALPTVECVDSFGATRRAVKKLLTQHPERTRALQVSRVALDMAFKDVCFDLSGYEAIFRSEELHMELARKALDGLALEMPEMLVESGNESATAAGFACPS